MKPVVIINFKTYNQGESAIKLAKEIEKFDSKIIIGVQSTNINQISKAIKNPVYAEHVDYQEPGRNTGYILPEAIKESGADGTFLNHSEHRLKFKIIKKTAKRCKSIGLKVGIFAKDLRQARKIKKLNPDYLIIEPPELVAGEISVSKAKPELIEDISKKLKSKFIVGAGVKTVEDLNVAMNLGASGIAVSSAITTSKNIKKSLIELLG
jgi:triosephosphate isomerase (TIM)